MMFLPCHVKTGWSSLVGVTLPIPRKVSKSICKVLTIYHCLHTMCKYSLLNFRKYGLFNIEKQRSILQYHLCKKYSVTITEYVSEVKFGLKETCGKILKQQHNNFLLKYQTSADVCL